MCSASDCNRPVIARGLCTKHYQRAKKAGELAPLPKKQCAAESCARGGPYRHGYCNLHIRRLRTTGRLDLRSTSDRFDEKWERDPVTGCHVWTGSKTQGGYGHFNANRRYLGAHLYAWEREHGPVPKGMQLDHIACDNPSCVNPAHLKIATPRENVLRSRAPSAQHARQTHCLRGHEFTEDNIYYPPDGRPGRQCRACIRLRTARKSTKGVLLNGH